MQVQQFAKMLLQPETSNLHNYLEKNRPHDDSEYHPHNYYLDLQSRTQSSGHDSLWPGSLGGAERICFQIIRRLR